MKPLVFSGILILSALPTQIFAHEENGCFAPTMAIDEPSVGDELDIGFSQNKHRKSDGSSMHSGALGVEISKVIFPHFGISIGSNYQRLRFEDRINSGFDNIEIGGKYEFYHNPGQNLLLSAGLVAEIGKTGNRKLAHSSTEIAPVLYFGKGMGNLSDEFKYLQPIAITGLISPSYCTKAAKIENVNLGLAIQYHLRHLNGDNSKTSPVAFWNNIIPIVEMPLSIGTIGHCRGKVKGSINPGVLFSGKYVQFGLEATIPINKRSGRNVGVLAQVHLFLDNIFK